MNKVDFLKEISKKSGFLYTDCDVFLKSFIDTFQECIEKREGLYLQGFGTLKFVATREFTIRNEFSSEKDIVIGGDERPRVYFVLSSSLKKNKKETTNKVKIVKKYVQKDFFKKLREED